MKLIENTQKMKPRIAARSTKGTVVVADDQPSILNIVSGILSRAGYSVVGASCGEAAVTLALLFAPDLLLTDFRMPGMNGVETARSVLEIDPTVRVLIMSACDRDELQLDPAFGFIRKPFKCEELREAVWFALTKPAHIHSKYDAEETA